MARDSYASLRLPPDLKDQVKDIADSQHRSLSNTIELLIRRGIEGFRQDGLLVELPRRTQVQGSPSHGKVLTDRESLAEEIAALVVASLEKREHSGSRPRKKSGRRALA